MALTYFRKSTQVNGFALISAPYWNPLLNKCLLVCIIIKKKH